MRSIGSGTHVLDSLAAGSSTSSDEDLSEFSFQSGPDSVMFDPSDCPSAGQLENTFVRLQEVELERSSLLSLSHRVELNRSILQHLLRSSAALSQSESREESVTGSDLDVSDLEDQNNGNKHRAFVSGPLPRQQQWAPGARMKRRPEPLRADHNLLTPDTRSESGVRFRPVAQVNSLPSYLSDSSHVQNIQTACSRSTRRRPSSSPNRRLRFEDETEKEAESRYQERQKRRSGQRIQDVLMSKPDVAQYVNGRHKTGYVGESEYIVGQSQDGVNLQLQPTPTIYNMITPSRPQICLRTEPIKETYIGVVRYSDEGETKVEDQRASKSWEHRRANHIDHNGFHKQTTPPLDLPVNPYAPDQIVSIAQSRVLAPFPPPKIQSSTSSPSTISAAVSQNGRTSETRTDKINNHKKCHNSEQNVKEQRTSVADTPQSKLQALGELKQEASLEERCQDPKIKTTFSSSSVSTVETQSRPTSNSDAKGKQPMRAKHDSVDSAFLEPVEGSRLSLRRLFSSVRLGRSRTNSLDRASSRSSAPAPDLVHPGSPSGSTRTFGLLKKTPSVQSLTMGSPFMKLRKSASVQNFVSEQKKKDRSDSYKPASQRFALTGHCC